MNRDMTPEERSKRQRLKNDFLYYAPNCLRIRVKSGQIRSFEMNEAQLYIHKRLEEQSEKTGKVRAIILKGRQQGCSTYVEGRFYHKTTHRIGHRTFILTHEQEATNNLFDMVARYHENCPEFVRPEVGASNAKELSFPGIDSDYRVGTAGNKSVGRSQTIQNFHGSEVAFWPNADAHVKGVMQAIPDMPDTEIILESTANGMGNFFHQQWKLAESGVSEYIPIFVPWFWQSEYRKDLPDGFKKTDEEELLAKNYDLDDNQIYWRRIKIAELSADGANGERSFMQEYPCNAAEAFQITGKNGLIVPEAVLRARKCKANPSGPLIVGVDPSRGGDRFSVIKRAGRKSFGLKSYVKTECDSLPKAVAICVKLLTTLDEETEKLPDMMFVDAGGGADLVDRLHELGFKRKVKAIGFGTTALDPERWPNKRSEMYGLCNQWLNDENMPVQIPDSDSLQADLCASLYVRDAHDRVKLKPKDEIKKELGFSPDEGDALVLTFAEPVFPNEEDQLLEPEWEA